MPIASASDLVDLIRRYRLLEPAQFASLSPLQTCFPNPAALARDLIQRNWLSAYQVNCLNQGHGQELLLGSYVLLEPLGEGGMGQVFKARHVNLGRVVALKRIRKERLANENAVRRFHREIRAAAQLSHPNIVLAYDADEVNGTHFFSMEFVEGQDLARFVAKHGPLPVAQACDCLRQAALGLQHAHERGLVHRDIKPHNLMRTARDGVVKIMDMGLARLDYGSEDNSASSTMTHEGTVMGTLDYIAPEQALNSHTADIRADLYSLGCTLFFLLAGRVPFAGGTAAEKLLRHQMEEPPPLTRFRADVPAEVAAVVRRLLAKRPEERYRTPGELATVLASLSAGLPLASAGAEERTTTLQATAGAATPAEDSGTEALDFRPTPESVEANLAEQRRRRRTEQRQLLAIAGGILFLIALIAGVLKLTGRAKTPTETPPIADKPARPKEDRAGAAERRRQAVAEMPAEEQVEAVAREMKKRNPGFDGALHPIIAKGVVVGLSFSTLNVSVLSPLSALRGLKELTCSGQGENGRVVDLSALEGLPLTALDCSFNRIKDLSPLHDMPLTSLKCHNDPIADLGPVRGMRLTYLDCANTPISDLSPLRRMPLTFLRCPLTNVSDLSPLKGTPLATLSCDHTPIRDLSPLKGLPLTFLDYSNTHVTDASPLKVLPLQDVICDFRPERDAMVLRSIKTLERINGKSAAEFWEQVRAAPANPKDR